MRLLKVTDRITITYRDPARKTLPAFKRKKRFQKPRFRTIGAGGHTREIMEFDRSSVAVSSQQTADDVIGNLVTELESDSAVAYASPVYLDPHTGKTVVFTDRIAVKFSDPSDESLRLKTASIIDAVIEREIMPAVYTFRCNTRGNFDILLRCRALEDMPGVEWAEPEMITEMNRYFTPDDPLFGRQWYLNNTGSNGTAAGADLGAVAAWDIQEMGDPSVTVAILDDGADLLHPDLTFAPGDTDFYNGDNDPSPEDPDDNHGTAVAGVVAAVGDNGIGVAGVAPGVSILPVKISQGAYFMSSIAIASAITWTYRNGADILNNSWGGGSPSASITTAIRNASTLGRNGKGCPVFFASGNYASTFTTYSFSLGTGTVAFAFVYQKDESVSVGDDCVVIDNLWITSSDGYTVSSTETFAGGGLPSGWSTRGRWPPTRRYRDGHLRHRRFRAGSATGRQCAPEPLLMDSGPNCVCRSPPTAPGKSCG